MADDERPQYVIRVHTNMSGFGPALGAKVLKVEQFDDHTEYLMAVGDGAEDSEPTADE